MPFGRDKRMIYRKFPSPDRPRLLLRSSVLFSARRNGCITTGIPRSLSIFSPSAPKCARLRYLFKQLTALTLGVAANAFSLHLFFLSSPRRPCQPPPRPYSRIVVDFATEPRAMLRAVRCGLPSPSFWSSYLSLPAMFHSRRLRVCRVPLAAAVRQFINSVTKGSLLQQRLLFVIAILSPLIDKRFSAPPQGFRSGPDRRFENLFFCNLCVLAVHDVRWHPFTRPAPVLVFSNIRSLPLPRSHPFLFSWPRGP